MVPPVSDRIPLVPPYSGYGYARTRFRIRGFHALRPAFPGRSPTKHASTTPSYNPGTASTAPVWAPPRSLATTCGITVVFSSCGYLDVSVPRVSPRYAMDLHTDDTPFIRAGFPHSDIRASSVVCTFTRLFAACHVLLRLQVPGHSPCALSSLTCSFSVRLTVFQSCSPFFLEVFFIRQRLS